MGNLIATICNTSKWYEVRNSCWRYSVKTDFLKNFANVTGKVTATGLEPRTT